MLIGSRVNKIPFDILISSPLQRAKETAQIIAMNTGKIIDFSDLFVERFKPTSITGKPHTDEFAFEQFKKWTKSLYTPNMRVEDGENFDDLINRAERAFEYLETRPENSFVIVTHGFFLRTLIAKVLLGNTITGENFELIHKRMEVENTGITVIKNLRRGSNNFWSLWVYNDHSHLG